MLSIALHEAGHSIKISAPNEWRELEKFVVNYLTSQNKNVSRMIEEQMAVYRASGQILTDDTALEEIVCNTLMSLASDEKALQTAIKSTDKNALQKIASAIKKIVAKIKSWLSDRNAISAEAYKPFMNDVNALMTLAEKFEKAAESGRGVKIEQEGEIRYSVENSFDEQVDNALKGKINKRNALFVSETSDVLLSVGMKQLPMLYTQSHLNNAIKPKNKNNMHAHGLTVEQIKYMPQVIKHPAIIMDSLSSNDDVVLISDKLDNEGAPIILVVHPNGKGVYELITQPSNFIKSYYGKDNDFKGYIQRAISNDKILYIDKNKSQSLYQQIGLQLPNGFNKLGFDKIIHQSNNNVNNNSMQENENNPSGIKYAIDDDYGMFDDLFEGETTDRLFVRKRLKDSLSVCIESDIGNVLNCLL